ncbi:SRSF protein kinase 3-like [Adelges cooleyi]|uniref:SRSF protein kinase 3-like n=1 Tax=Adelges cooleyi TaxID=133065 RepID=UPI00217F805A|nr:SRSF protein kinase 3-like [Adelges cooleyi]
MDSDDEVLERTNRRTVPPRRRLLPVPPTTVAVAPLFAVSAVVNFIYQCYNCSRGSLVSGVRLTSDVVLPKVCATCGVVFTLQFLYRTNRVYNELSTLTDDRRGSAATGGGGGRPMSRPDTPLEDRFDDLRLSKPVRPKQRTVRKYYTSNPQAPARSITTNLLLSESENEEPIGLTENLHYSARLGSHVNGYDIISQLGFGHFSTVWLAKNIEEPSFAALKIVKSSSEYTMSAIEEIRFLKCINRHRNSNFFGQRVIELIDDFVVDGPRGDHIVLALEVLGPNVLALIEKTQYHGLPLHLLRNITRQVLQGLAFLHDSCDIIHTDIKPENILLCAKPEYIKTLANQSYNQFMYLKKYKNGDRPPQSVIKFKSLNDMIDQLGDINIKIADLGNGRYAKSGLYYDKIQTRQYRSLEVLLGSGYDTHADIWSTACVIFEMATGDFLFDPHKGPSFTKDDDHIAHIIELLGNIPLYIINMGKYSCRLFTDNGEMKYISKLKPWYLADVLISKYDWSVKEAHEVAAFLIPMLDMDSNNRASATQCLLHPWLYC